MSNPFLLRFPEEKQVYTINIERINGFLKFTSHTEASSIGMKAAQQIKKLNDLGFITSNSQEGIYDEVENPKYAYGENKGQRVRSEAGSPAVKSIVSERAYCEGFIRNELLEDFYNKLKECNPMAELLIYPDEKMERVNLTKEYIKYEDGTEYRDDLTNSPEMLLEEIQFFVTHDLTDTGYYEGPPLDPMPIDLNRWSFVLAVDMTYGHNCLTEPDGLFLCIETALKAALATAGGKKSPRRVKMMNRQLRTKNLRRCSYRKRGGGFSVQTALVPQPTNDFTFAAKVPVNLPYSDCADATRPGQLVNHANPALAQTAMAGGRRRRSMRRTQRGSGCTTRNMRGGNCGCAAMRGGSYGFAVDPSVSVGGTGPNVAPLHTPVPCDARAGMHTTGNPDVRAPADVYSLTPNQTGGAANAYGPECYRATGSQLPVYNASSAGFSFSPSTQAGATLPDGVTAFMEVNPVAARTGGSRRRRNRRRTQRKH